MKKRLDEIFRRFFAPDDGGGNGGGEGSGGGGNGEGADGGENGAGDGQGNAGENGDGAGKGGGDGSGQGGGEGGEGEGSDEGGESLLAGDEGEGGGEGDEGDAKPPTPEEVIKFSEAIKVKGPDGKDIDVDKEAIAALSPVLMKHKMTPEAASELVGVYAAYALGEQVKAQKAHMDQLKTIREATQKEFGEDLPRIAKEANVGGKAIFGKLWNTLRGIPEFSNQADVIRGLAAHGRSVMDDGGTGGDGGGNNSDDGQFSADGWINSSNKKGRSTATDVE
ncbi:MAG: hypothetical protein WCR47_05085 [Desulfoplanes sp.]